MDREGLKAFLLLAAKAAEHDARARRSGGKADPKELVDQLKSELGGAEALEALEKSLKAFTLAQPRHPISERPLRFEEYNLLGAAVDTLRRGEATKGLYVKHIPEDWSHYKGHKKPPEDKEGVITGNPAEFAPGKRIPITGYHATEAFLRRELDLYGDRVTTRFFRKGLGYRGGTELGGGGKGSAWHVRMLKDLIKELGLNVRYRSAKVWLPDEKDYWDPPNYTVWDAYTEALANVLRTADKQSIKKGWLNSEEATRRYLYNAVRDEGRRVVIERAENDFRAWGHGKREEARREAKDEASERGEFVDETWDYPEGSLTPDLTGYNDGAFYGDTGTRQDALDLETTIHAGRQRKVLLGEELDDLHHQHEADSRLHDVKAPPDTSHLLAYPCNNGPYFSTDVSHSELLEFMESEKVLQLIRGALPKQQSKVMILRATGHTSEEIAGLLGTETSTVRRNLSNARKNPKLHRIVRERGLLDLLQRKAAVAREHGYYG